VVTSLDFSNSKIDYLFTGGILALIQQANQVTNLSLQGAQISEEDLERIRSAKLKAAKIVDVILPSGETIQIKHMEPTKPSKVKAYRKSTTR
jgi:hypothetical protein